MKWQPIETAPKDGTRILAFIKTQGQCVVYYDKHPEAMEWVLNISDARSWDRCYSIYPEYWMPLPSAPTSATHRQSFDAE